MGSSKQASDYEITDDFFVMHIKNTFNQGNNVSEALKRCSKQTQTSGIQPSISVPIHMWTTKRKKKTVRDGIQRHTVWSHEMKPNIKRKIINCMPCYGKYVLTRCKKRLNQYKTTIVRYTTTWLHYYKQSRIIVKLSRDEIWNGYHIRCILINIYLNKNVCQSLQYYIRLIKTSI